METRFIESYIDELTFSSIDEKDMVLLRKHGYTPDEQGEVEVSFKFGDGIAYVPNRCGLVLRYPTLAEVKGNEVMQREITRCTGISNEINQKDVALRYGILGEYRFVYDYDEWYKGIADEGQEWTEIWHLDAGEGDVLDFDVFEDEYVEMDDAGLIDSGDDTDGHSLAGKPTKEEIWAMQAKYGVLWTEWIGDHVFDERGFLHRIEHKPKVWVVESCRFIDEQNYLDCFTEVYTDEERAKLRVNELAKEYEHEGEIDTWGSLVGEYGYAFYYMDESKRKVKYAERELL